MRLGRRLVLPLLLGVAAVGGGAPHAAASVRPGASDITLVSSEQLDSRLTELTLSTAAIPHDTGVRVLLPSGYDSHPNRRYPVLFLLHGSGGNETDWTEMGEAEAATAPYPLIVVMPDTDQNGYYTDWYNGGAFGPPEYETYEIRELIPWIDSNYRTIAARSGRAVAGLSMGGFGALSYAARHPDLFVHVAGFSPASDTNYGPFILLQESGNSDGDPTVNIWGERTTQEVRWHGHNPWDLAQNYRGMDISLRYGTGDPGGPFGGGDPIEAGVHAMTVGFDAKLTALGIPHVNDDYGPGGHAWPYWQRDLVEELPLIMKSFRHPPQPAPVDYRTIDPKYGVFGWRVSIEREALEFSSLNKATRRGFRLSGSGSATVTTPARYRPGEQLKVRICTDSGDCRGQSMSASAGGRLRIAVPLGPANPDQEYTTQAGLDGGTRVFKTRVGIKR